MPTPGHDYDLAGRPRHSPRTGRCRGGVIRVYQALTGDDGIDTDLGTITLAQNVRSLFGWCGPAR